MLKIGPILHIFANLTTKNSKFLIAADSVGNWEGDRQNTGNQKEMSNYKN